MPDISDTAEEDHLFCRPALVASLGLPVHAVVKPYGSFPDAL
jgi:hypothetical protein